MKFKTLILVSVVAVLIGFGIFFLFNKAPSENSLISPKRTFFSFSKPSPTPTPKPTLPPLDANSDLLQETEKLGAPEFSKDFNSLREQVRNVN